ncbi:VOC family protein [Streptomyces sp. JJ66]|uniref:VOC family protein n=1 Tax=Streptomyces sp. JJ66 TaxID=2803843 RepID=UPI001C5A34A3|nr:VOC family protein [Streptomyces sp. JJ66]MBW1602707.1 VOC family protein [Streptomyces sp. JJ66]
MAITKVHAVIPVADHSAACSWYSRLWGRPADREPMSGLAEWHAPGGGAIQVFHDPTHAGSAAVTLAVEDVDALARTHDAPAPQNTSAGFRLTTLPDPDGNTLTLVQQA